MKTYILNDTRGCWHSGSDAVMDVLECLLRQAGHEIIGSAKCGAHEVGEESRDADLIVCNGEGTFHGGNGEGLLVFLKYAKYAKDRGAIKTALVNALWDQRELTWVGNRLETLDLLAVRDPFSLRQLSHLEPKLYPDLAIDACPAMEPHDRAPYTLWGRARGQWYRDIPKKDGSRVSLWDRNFDKTVFELNYYGACYVTGEHHGIYAAILAGVPFVAIPGNSHKIQALVEWFGWGRVCTDAEQVQAGIHHALDTRKEYLEARERFLVLPRMTAEDFKL